MSFLFSIILAKRKLRYVCPNALETSSEIVPSSRRSLGRTAVDKAIEKANIGSDTNCERNLSGETPCGDDERCTGRSETGMSGFR